MIFRSLTISLCLALLLSACTPPTFWQEKQRQKTFTEALDHYLSEQDRTFLEEIALSQPATPWSQRAQQLVNRLDKLEQQQQDTAQELQITRQHCAENMQLLEQENQDLQETMDQLKQLFIDMELRE
ncbi:hypothetical protein HTZ97_06650 [Desulfuromonas acetoxidans]|uniref:Lipoprotein n=1 Tax=Desulfuromonas acetoxidans (strain DSM 684 / 11070) TaxID=281689 RepID=Q1K1Q2_DESA6|nr:hypothetical protein [Desulfuromonas acetoxidans]EAT16336.1 hypothetical protein Dace_1800 [Desulfuromonas acetoxidans DSM 684]MBF0645987.1 hypothetical protein [Desulfuromonas acetoxidans]NVD23475.1 hypothetical protein [Desulfuromonas acetoxidans]NVE16139.1 hypothetical protein [Desulfuromonas acetoxidans]